MDESYTSDEEPLNQTLIADDIPACGATSGLSQSELFAVVENAVSPAPIVHFFDKQQTQRGKKIVASLNKVKTRRLFGALSALLQRVVQEEAHVCIDDGDERPVQSLRFLKLCADFAYAHISTAKKTVVDEVLDVATLLHDSLFALHEADGTIARHAAAASSSIFLLCEKWWHARLDDKEQLVTQLIPLLLLSSLQDTATKADVKRLYSMREAFDLLDFTDPSIASLQTQLLRTISQPLFLHCLEGKRFLSHLFTLKELVVALHSAVKVQILSKRSILEAYAEVYWGAWKHLATAETGEDEEAREDAFTSLEENALQDLAYMTIHAASPTTAKNCRILLDKFLLYKKDPEVEGMLYRVYGPILWRSVLSSNARVRMQAAVALGDTFPLKDGSSRDVVRYEAVVTKTVEAVVKLMRDEIPNVRVEGCICAGKILKGFWVAIPSSDIRILLNEIIAKQASDMTSAPVRTTAIETITSLLSEDKTHAVLRPLLPSLGNVIHDKNEKVRLAVVRMLLFVKSLKGMKYYHVVPAKHLLARLADEGRGKNNPIGPVAQALTELLSNSFFPTGNKKTMADVIGRTFRLLQDEPAAALVFYKNASTQLSVHSIAKLISALMKCLCFLVIEEKKGMSEDVSRLELSAFVEEKWMECGEGGAVGGPRMVIIAESISVLWESIENDAKDVDENVKKMLAQAFSGKIITEVFCHLEAKCNNSLQESNSWNEFFRGLVAILNCAGKLDTGNINGMRAHVISQLENSWNISAEQRAKSNFSPYAALLCKDMTEELTKCLASSISNYFEGKFDHRPRKKKVRANTTLPSLHIDVCLNILGHILHGTDSSLVTARESMLNCKIGLEIIIKALKKAQEEAEKVICGSSTLEVSDDLIRNIGKCIECHAKFLLHKNSGKDDLMPIITWVSKSIVPSLTKLIDQGNALRDLDLSGISGIDSPMHSPDLTSQRKSSRNSSSPRMSLGLTSNAGCGSFHEYQDQSKFVFAIRAALSSMTSVVLVMADWLFVHHVSLKSIPNTLVNWCQLLRYSEIKAHDSTLLYLFCRIGLLYLRKGDSALFDAVLTCVEHSQLTTEEEQEFASFTCRGFVSLHNEIHCKLGIASVVKKICTSTQKYNLDENEREMETSILDRVSPGIKALSMALVSDKRTSLILAQHVSDLSDASVKTDLFNMISTHASKTAAMNAILKKWSDGHLIVDDAHTETSQ